MMKLCLSGPKMLTCSREQKLYDSVDLLYVEDGEPVPSHGNDGKVAKNLGSDGPGQVGECVEGAVLK